MAITLGTRVTGHVVAGAGITLSSVTCSGSDRVLEVEFAIANNSLSMDTVVFNGSESMSLLRFRNVTSGAIQRIEVWGLTAPSAATGNVVGTLVSGVGNITAIAQPYSGVDQTTPRDGAPLWRDGEASGTTPSDTSGTNVVWGGGDDLQVFWLSIKDDTLSWTADAGVTQRANVTASNASNAMRAVMLTDTNTEANKVFGVIGSATSWSVIGYNMNAAGGGGGGGAIAPIAAHYNLQGTI